MTRNWRTLAIYSSLATVLVASHPAFSQKHGGILKLYSPATPASMSPLEEATIVAEMPMMGVFNNLILFDQHLPQVSLESIRPELATKWQWNEDGTELTFPARRRAMARQQAVHSPGRQMHLGSLSGDRAGKAACQSA